MIHNELKEIDEVIEKLITYYEEKGAKIVTLSEYGISPVTNPIHINTVLRKNALLNILIERDLELLYAGASNRKPII